MSTKKNLKTDTKYSPSLPNFRFFLVELEDFEVGVEALVLLEDDDLSLFFHRINIAYHF